MTWLTRTLVGAALLVLSASSSHASTVAGTVTIDRAPAADAVVYLEGAVETPPTPGHAVMDQKNLQFLPKLLPVARGTTVEFTNSDDIQHNVFSPSAIAGKFDLGAYGPGALRTVTLSDPGEVLVLCNIHMEMEARILVLRDPYFGLAAADGTYRIPAVPPGRYTAKVWHDGFLSDVRSVDVGGDGDGDVVLDLQLNR
jgi:plastocyanin